MPDPAVFFCTGGGEAIDTAAKIVRRYWALTRRAAADGGRLAPVRLPRHERVRHVALGDPRGARRLRDARRRRASRSPTTTLTISPARSTSSATRAAAFIGEPMIGAGGAIPPPDGYWPAVERICRERGVLLIADEVISGFGRLGRWFGCERYGFTPDLLTCAKGISSGYVPLGAVVVSDRVRAALLGRRRRRRFSTAAPTPGTREPASQGSSTSTSSSASASSSVRRRSSRVLRELLEPLAELPGVAEVRCAGLAAGVELDGELLADNPAAGPAVVMAARRHGVISRLLRGVALQISPPLVVSEDELARDRGRDRRRRPRDVLAAARLVRVP